MAARPAWVLLPAAGLLLAQWLLLAVYGLPATHDGFWHLNWTESAVHALWREGSWPRWYAEAWGGSGSATFTYYPPLLRWLALPFGAFAGPASLPLQGAIGLLLLGQALAAHDLLRRLPLGPRLHAALLALVLLQPYWLTNVWIRGAWPEALAMLALWPLAASVLAAVRGEAAAAFVRSLLGAAILLLSNNPVAVLAAYALTCAGSVLLLAGQARRMLPVLGGLLGGALLAAGSVLPVLLEQPAIRLATGDHLLPLQWPLGEAQASAFARSLGPLWWWAAAVLGVTLLARRRLAPGPLVLAFAAVLALALLLMLPPSAVIYPALPALGKIQFPWRWMAIASTTALLLLSLLATSASAGLRRLAVGLAGLGSGLALFPLDELRFLPAAQQRLDAVFRCERSAGDCSRFVAADALADRFDTLRFAGQDRSHYGPWIADDGRVWRYEVYDYMPRGIWVETWPRAQRNRLAMAPLRPLPTLRAVPAEALQVLGERRRGQRWSLDIRLAASSELVLERLRFHGGELRVRPLHGGAWASPVLDGNDPYHRFVLPAGDYRLLWRYVGTPAERAGAALAGATLLGLLGWALWRRLRPRATR